MTDPTFSYRLKLVTMQNPFTVEKRYSMFLLADGQETGMFHFVSADGPALDKLHFDKAQDLDDILTEQQFVYLRERCRRLRAQHIAKLDA